MYYISRHKCPILFTYLTAGLQEVLDCFSCHLLSACLSHFPHINIILSPTPTTPTTKSISVPNCEHNRMTNIRKSQTHFPWKWWKHVVRAEIEMYVKPGRCHCVRIIGSQELTFLLSAPGCISWWRTSFWILLTPLERPLCLCNSERREK